MDCLTDECEGKIAEGILPDSDELFRATFEDAVRAKWLMALDGCYIKVNQAYCDLLGYTEAELLTLSIKDITPTEELQQGVPLFIELINGRINCYERETRILNKQGEEIWVSLCVTLVRNVDGTPFFISGELNDITSYKQAEETRLKLFKQLEMATVTAKLGVWTLDIKSHRVEWNDVMLEIYGITREEFTGTLESWRSSVHPYDLPYAESNLSRSYKGEQVFGMRFRIIRPNGDIRHIEASICPQFDEHGEVIACLGINVDETARFQAEQQLRHSQEELEAKVARRTSALTEAIEAAERANLAKSEFLSRTSHELRTPLNAILGFAQILEIGDLSDDQKQSIEYILRGGRHLLGLINELLDLSRVSEGKEELALEPVALSEAMDEVLALIGPVAEQSEIKLHTDPKSWCDVHVLADGQRLRQVLLNLVSNAIKYNREGGSVTLGCEIVSPASADSNECSARIKVIDTGVGIKPEQLEKLYVPFNRLGAERTHIEGTGLGLAISKALMEAMNGTLDAQSALGVGSTFTVELPLSQADCCQNAPECRVPEFDSTSSAAKTILYIEDNLSNFDLVAMILRSRDKTTLLPAIEGGIGLEMARLHQPDLILLDLNLPDIMGDEVLTRLRADAATADIPVIILSADATQVQVNRLLSLGAEAYLPKPFDVKAFLDTVETTLTQG